MTTDEVPFLSITGRDSTGFRLSRSRHELFFSLTASSNIILWIDREVVSQVQPLSDFHETPFRALTSSVIRPSGSSPLGLEYTTTYSVYNRGTSCGRWRDGKLSSRGFGGACYPILSPRTSYLPIK